MDGNNMNMENQTADYSYAADSTNATADYTYAADGTYEVVEKKSNALAIVALVTGILSIVCCCSPLLSFLPTVAAIVCGAIGIKKCEKVGMAKAGMILGIVGAVFIVLSIILSIVSGGLSMMDYVNSYDSYYYY